MNFQAELKSTNVKMKKDGQDQYKITQINLETYKAEDWINSLVNQEVSVKIQDVDFIADLVNVTVAVKKVNKVPMRYYKIRLELEGTKDALSPLVTKYVQVELGE